MLADTMAGIIAAWMSIEFFDPGLGKSVADKLFVPIASEATNAMSLEIATNYVMSIIMDVYYGLKAAVIEIWEEFFDGD